VIWLLVGWWHLAVVDVLLRFAQTEPRVYEGSKLSTPTADHADRYLRARLQAHRWV